MSERRGTGDGQGAKQRAAARGKAQAEAAKTAKTAKPDTPRQAEDRNLRRAVFLAELAEAKELRKRVAPRKTRNAELHARLLRTFRY
jgi:hypothetical protein